MIDFIGVPLAKFAQYVRYISLRKMIIGIQQYRPTSDYQGTVAVTNWVNVRRAFM